MKESRPVVVAFNGPVCDGPCGGEPATMPGGLCPDCWAESGGTMRYVGGEV